VLPLDRLQEIHDAVFRVKGSVRRDFRRGKRLSRQERLMQWRKPYQAARTLSPQLWAQLPQVLQLRVVRCQMAMAGFRTRQPECGAPLCGSAAANRFQAQADPVAG
jgi:hypothetical protein